MFTSFKLISHKFEDSRGDQLLVDHLTGVTKIALETSKLTGIHNDEIENVIKIIGMAHDFGKASSYFQRYLKGEYRESLKNHGEISAYLAYYLLPEPWKLIGFICVKRHHGDINLDNNFFISDNEDDLIKISEDIRKNKDEVEEIYKLSLNDFFEKMKDKSLLKEVKTKYIMRNIKNKKKLLLEQEEEFIWLQYLWSLLLTADKTQLIRIKTFHNSDILKEEFTFNYKNKIRSEIANKNPDIVNTNLFKIRDKVYDQAIDAIKNINLKDNRKLSINVPTGTGKTIAVYGAAFKLSERIREEEGYNPNIIYCIPFMSVIDQNYEVLDEILESNNLKVSSELIMKHHSMSPIRYIDDHEKEYTNYDARFLVENWQSTIITTTFVQLFNSIFKSGKNSIMHRFHKLAGSIIILDEVQAVPTKFYPIIEDLFNILCEEFNCYVITVTATKPLFIIGKELITDNEKIFSELDRIEIQNNTENDIELDDFISIVTEDIEENEDKSYLIILNTVKSALEVFNILDEEFNDVRKVVYLSTEILPIRRLEIINEVKSSKEKYILVSTQLIEAGVDIDFDIVYRDLAPLDCINQSAGRANRNSIKGKGIVKIYSILNENGKRYSCNIYSTPLINATLNILKDKYLIKEKDIWNLNNLYFKEVKSVTEGKALEEYDKYVDSIKKLELQKIREFELIEDNKFKRDVIIRYNEETEELIKIIENYKEYEEQDVVNAWRGLNKYRISVSWADIKDLVHEIRGTYFLNKEDYDINKGVIKRKHFFL